MIRLFSFLLIFATISIADISIKSDLQLVTTSSKEEIKLKH